MISLTNPTPNVLVPSVLHSELQASSISVIIGCLHDCKVSHSSKKWVKVSSDLPHRLYVASEPPHEKTNNLHMRKQRRRSASQ